MEDTWKSFLSGMSCMWRVLTMEAYQQTNGG